MTQSQSIFGQQMAQWPNSGLGLILWAKSITKKQIKKKRSGNIGTEQDLNLELPDEKPIP